LNNLNETNSNHLINGKELQSRTDKSFLIVNQKEKDDFLNEISTFNKELLKNPEKNLILLNNTNTNTNSTNINSSSGLITNNNFNNLHIKEEIKIEDYLNSKDVVFFDLEFEEIWLQVEMTLLSDDNKSLVISFEIKIETDEFINNLTKLLIKMGMKSWAKYILDMENNPDFYLLTHFKYIENINNNFPIVKNNINNLSNIKETYTQFNILNINPGIRKLTNYFGNNYNNELNKTNNDQINLEILHKNLNNTNDNKNKISGNNLDLIYRDKENSINLSGFSNNIIEEEMDDFQERVKNKYNFESKIKCQLEFSNFVDLIYKNKPRNSDEKLSVGSKCENKEKKLYRNIIKEFTSNTFKNEIFYNHCIGFHKIIFWKCNPEEVENLL